LSTTGNRKTAHELDDALRLLDHELNGLQLNEPVQIRAIGGYALLKHGVRRAEEAYTVDIDTVTADYSAAVIAAIERVAEKAGLDPDWLNNYNLMGDPEDVEQVLDAEWLPQPMDLRNIAVSIASVPTLTRAKIIAADTAALSGRQRDASDLEDLLEHQGIKSLSDFQRLYPDPYDEYPDAQALVRRHLGVAGAPKAKDRFPELNDVSLDGLDEDWADLDSVLVDHDFERW